MSENIINDQKENNIQLSNVPKKRGRKPKNANIGTETVIPNPTDNQITEVKKRGRKPTCQVINNTEIYNLKKEVSNDCLFVHIALSKLDIEKITNNERIDEEIIDTKQIQISENKTKKIDLQNDDYNNNFDNNMINKQYCEHCINCDKLQEKIDILESKYHIGKLNDMDRQTYNINIKIEDVYTGSDIWENKYSNICCWWCCHKFDTLPIGLPEKFFEKKFFVLGYFCSFNCSLAYNLSLNDHKIWDRISLLYHMRNLIYLNIYPNGNIKNLDDIIVAGPRSLLKMFGGNFDIEQFRENSIILKKQYRHIIPPIVALTQQIEESTYKQNQNIIIKQPKNKTLSNFSNNMASGLVLKRTKPLTSKTSLFNMMNIQHVSEI
jgi:hypothetical protein